MMQNLNGNNNRVYRCLEVSGNNIVTISYVLTAMLVLLKAEKYME
jgi:hypothetical protein